jgi:hypothetical protein
MKIIIKEEVKTITLSTGDTITCRKLPGIIVKEFTGEDVKEKAIDIIVKCISQYTDIEATPEEIFDLPLDIFQELLTQYQETILGDLNANFIQN